MENQTVSMLRKYHILDIKQTTNCPKFSISYQMQFRKSIALKPTNTNFEKKNTNANDLEEE